MNARGRDIRAASLRNAHGAATLARVPIRPPSAIRRATRADLDALLALEEATFASDRIDRSQWRRHIASPTVAVLVSGRSGSIDGAAVVFYRRRARSARLYSIAVGTHARGAGLGATLLAAAEADALARGRKSMRLE
ncbi:MAG: GNAT family N-acetyltransferase, partial [Rhodanobacteraceae bacterium]